MMVLVVDGVSWQHRSNMLSPLPYLLVGLGSCYKVLLDLWHPSGLLGKTEVFELTATQGPNRYRSTAFRKTVSIHVHLLLVGSHASPNPGPLWLVILYHTMLFYIVLDYSIDYTIVLVYYTILYYTILYYTILYYTILYYTILYCTILYYTILYYTVLYCTVRYGTLLYSTLLYSTLLYSTLLYYTILYYTLHVVHAWQRRSSSQFGDLGPASHSSPYQSYWTRRQTFTGL